MPPSANEKRTRRNDISGRDGEALHQSVSNELNNIGCEVSNFSCDRDHECNHSLPHADFFSSELATDSCNLLGTL